MTDDFDVSLRRRLESLAAAVPVAQPGEVTAVVPQKVQPRSTSRLALAGLLPVLAVVVIGAVIAAAVKIGPFVPGDSQGPATNAANDPIEATTRSGDFELTIRSAKARYAVDEPIDIEASLTHRGSEPVQIAHAMGAAESPLGFGIEEAVVGDLRIAPTTEDACVRSTLEPGQPLVVAFAKSGGWSGDDPRSADYRAFMQDPVLRLGSGTWHVYAVASFSIAECAPDPLEMRVDLAIEVVEQDPASTPEPQTTDGASIDLMTAAEPATGCYQAYTEGRLVRDPVTGLGIGQDAARGVVWPYGFTAREEVGVAVLVGTDGQVVAREGQVVGFSGPGASGEDGLIHACEVRIVEADSTDDPALDAVRSVDDDGTFRLALRSSKSVYEAGEPLDIGATLVFIGGSGTTMDFSGGISVTGEQTDGTHSFAPGGVHVGMCVVRPIEDLPNEFTLADWDKVRSLPPGSWRISASFSGGVPACTQDSEGHGLAVSIDITVVPTSEPVEPIDLATSTVPGEPSAEPFCRGGDGTNGELALHPTSGLGRVSSSGELQPIRWPFGFTAEMLPDGAILYGERGQIVAREGDSISFPGASAADGVFTICGQFHFG